MEARVISIANDFTRYPGGRYRTDGKFSGERFREDLLIPAVSQGEVVIQLDGTAGYGSSFLEEAFGGLARAGILSVEELLGRIRFVSSDQTIIDEIVEYISSTRH